MKRLQRTEDLHGILDHPTGLPWNSLKSSEDLPSGKKPYNELERSTHVLWKNQLFQLGHVLCRKLEHSLPEAKSH